MRRAPAMPELYQHLGDIAIQERRYAEATSHLRLYLALSAETAFSGGVGWRIERGRAYSQLGLAYAELGRIEESVRALREAARLSPRVEQIHVNLAIALELAGRPAEARKALERALDNEPGHTEARQRLAELEAAQSEGGQAPVPAAPAPE